MTIIGANAGCAQWLEMPNGSTEFWSRRRFTMSTRWAGPNRAKGS